MASNNFDYFDKFCNMFPDSIHMKQIVELALIGKVISSYKIDSLTSFHDQLMSGLWKKSLNGRIYPLDNRFEEILYIEINENFEPNFEKSLEKLRNFSVAPQMFDEMHANETESSDIVDPENGQDDTQDSAHNLFDEMPGNELVKSDTVAVENGQTDSQAVVDQVFDEITAPNPHLSNTQMEGVDNAHMFDTMPIPDFIIEMAQAAEITQGDSTGGSDELGSDDVSVDYGPPRDISQDVHIGYDLIEDAQLPSAHEVSDEKSQGYSVSTEHSDFESTLCNVHIEHRDYLDYQRHMFAKLATLDGSLFQHLISIGANRERFSTLENTLFDDRHLSHKIELCDENFRPCYQLFQGTCLLCCDLLPVNLTSQGLNSTLSDNFLNKSCDELSPQIVIYDPGDTIIYVLTYLVVFDPRTTGLGGQTIGQTGNRQIFDPGGHGCLICDVELRGFDPFASLSCCVALLAFMANTNNQALDEWHGLWFYTLEDKGDFRGGEEKVLVKNVIQSTNVVISWFECLLGLTKKNVVVVAYTFDPGGLHCQFDYCMDCCHSSDLEEVSDTDLALERIMCNLKCVRDRHTTNFPILMTIALINSFIFDPGGSSDKNLVNRTLTLEGFVEFARDGAYGMSDCNEAATICWDEYIKSVSLIFGLGDVLNHCHVRLSSDLLSWSIFLSYYKFKAREIQKGFIWDPGIIAKIVYEQFIRANVSRDGCWRSNIMIAVQFFRISDIGARFVNFDNVLLILMMSEVLLLGTSEQRSFLMKLRAPLLVVFDKEAFGFILIIAFVNADARVILIFDPGGKRLEVIRRGFAGVGCNGFFCVGIDGLNNRSIMLRTDTSLSKLLKENLRVAIQSFRLLIVIYIFDPGGSLVAPFCTVVGIIACLIFDP